MNAGRYEPLRRLDTRKETLTMAGSLFRRRMPCAGNDAAVFFFPLLLCSSARFCHDFLRRFKPSLVVFLPSHIPHTVVFHSRVHFHSRKKKAKFTSAEDQVSMIDDTRVPSSTSIADNVSSACLLHGRLGH